MRLMGRSLSGVVAVLGIGAVGVGAVGVAAVGVTTLGAATAAAANERPSAAPLCPACGHNLILNPGAEGGLGTNSDSVVKIPDWKQTNGFTAAQYAWSGGDLSPTTPGPKNRGKNYFYGGPSILGGPTANYSTGTQMITVAPGEISTGKVTYLVSAWLGGLSDQGDNATLRVTFENSKAVALSMVKLGPVTEAQRDSASELLFCHETGTVPVGTAMVKVKLSMDRESGSDNDGLADDLRLVFSPPSGAAAKHTIRAEARCSL